MAESTELIGAVIVAAGSGRRFGELGPRKQYRDLSGKPLLLWALAPFVSHASVGQIVVVLPPGDLDAPPRWLGDLSVHLVAGGAERAESVLAGLEALSGIERVLVHDGARPLVSMALIDRVLSADPSVGAVPGVRVVDTLKEVNEEGVVLATPPRERYWRAQTPQAFPLDALLRLHRRARAEGVTTTDDAALFERYGYEVRMVEGDPTNIKVTTPVDLALAAVLAETARASG